MADADIRGPPAGRGLRLVCNSTPVRVSSSGTDCAHLDGGYGTAAGTLSSNFRSPASPPLLAAAEQGQERSTASPGSLAASTPISAAASQPPLSPTIPGRWPHRHQSWLLHSYRCPPLPVPVAVRHQTGLQHSSRCHFLSPAVPPPVAAPSQWPVPSPVSHCRQPRRHPGRRHHHQLQWQYRTPLRAFAARDKNPPPPRLHAEELRGGWPRGLGERLFHDEGGCLLCSL